MRKRFWIFLLMISVQAIVAQEYQLGKPLIHVSGEDFFTESVEVKLNFRLEGAAVHYTLDGSEPTMDSPAYKAPIHIEKSTHLTAKAFKAGFLPSAQVERQFIKLSAKLPEIEISPGPKPPYAGDGELTLTDQKAGSLNFRDGRWLGYDQGPLTLTIDLKGQDKISELILSTLNSPGSWIMPPTSIEWAHSKDGKAYVKVDKLEIDQMAENSPGGKAYYSLKLPKHTFRYLRLVVTPLPSLPEWHPGKGNRAWLFIDEVILN